MIEVRQYLPEDYMRIARRTFDLVTFANFTDPYSVALNLARGPAFTGVSNGDIIACGGILPIWKRVGEAWVVTSRLVEKFPFTFGKVVWRNLNMLIKAMDLERIQTTIHVDHEISIKWAERMGFRNEGVMEKYIGGRDYYRYALIKER